MKTLSSLYGVISGTSSTLKTGDYTILDNDGIITIFVTGNSTIILPTASIKRYLKIVKKDSNTITTILSSGSDTIEGNISITLNTLYDTLQLESDGINLWVIF